MRQGDLRLPGRRPTLPRWEEVLGRRGGLDCTFSKTVAGAKLRNTFSTPEALVPASAVASDLPLQSQPVFPPPCVCHERKDEPARPLRGVGAKALDR
jgi:hypothetical protein